MGILSKKVRYFFISLLTTFPVCAIIQVFGNVTDTVSTETIEGGALRRRRFSHHDDRKERCG